MGDESMIVSSSSCISPDMSISADSNLYYPRQDREARQNRQLPWPTSQNVVHHSPEPHKKVNIIYQSETTISVVLSW